MASIGPPCIAGLALGISPRSTISADGFTRMSSFGWLAERQGTMSASSNCGGAGSSRPQATSAGVKSMGANRAFAQLRSSSVPPTSELCSKQELVKRHPHLLTLSRVQWALRNRLSNGLESVVYKCKSGRLVVHEPEFMRWYLGLTGLSKPRATWVRRNSQPVQTGPNAEGRIR